MGNRASSNAENPLSLDHLTANPRYQNTLRDIYSSNSSIPAFPGTFLASDFDELNHRNTPVSIKKTTPVKSDFLFEKNSVSFIPAGAPNLFNITFRFSCRTNIEITIYFRARDLTNADLITEEISIDTDKYPPSQTFNFAPGKDQAFSSTDLILNTKLYPKDDLSTVLNDQYPLIIKFESKVEGLDIPKSRLYTYYTLKCEGSEKCEAKMFKQKLEYKNKSYILDDIYGITNSEKSADVAPDSKDCSICLVNKLNTVVLPCKHICLCVECAKNLRFRNNQKCPICRKVVDTFLILKKTGRRHPEQINN